MPNFLRLALYGKQQAWGKETVGPYRPTMKYPTRSGITGLLAAASGVDMRDIEGTLAIDRSYTYAVRCEKEKACYTSEGVFYRPLTPGKIMTDYHMRQNAPCQGRDNGPDKWTNGEQSWREYLVDQYFFVVLKERGDAPYPLEAIRKALLAPVYQPYLGRRNCFPGEEILIDRESVLVAESIEDVLLTPYRPEATIPSREARKRGFVSYFKDGHENTDTPTWSEERLNEEMFGVGTPERVRDVPQGRRLFGSRTVFMYISA